MTVTLTALSSRQREAWRALLEVSAELAGRMVCRRGADGALAVPGARLDRQPANE